MEEHDQEQHDQAEGILFVERTAFGKEEITEEKISVQKFRTTPATVSMKAGCTVNLGNYESGRIDVMVSVPCYKEEIEDMLPKVKELVDGIMTTEYSELKASAKK